MYLVEVSMEDVTLETLRDIHDMLQGLVKVQIPMSQLRLPTKCEGGLDLVENHFAHDISRVNVDSADCHHLSSFPLI